MDHITPNLVSTPVICGLDTGGCVRGVDHYGNTTIPDQPPENHYSPQIVTVSVCKPQYVAAEFKTSQYPRHNCCPGNVTPRICRLTGPLMGIHVGTPYVIGEA
jgi:hypothetical protein